MITWMIHSTLTEVYTILKTTLAVSPPSAVNRSVKLPPRVRTTAPEKLTSSHNFLCCNTAGMCMLLHDGIGWQYRGTEWFACSHTVTFTVQMRFRWIDNLKMTLKSLCITFTPQWRRIIILKNKSIPTGTIEYELSWTRVRTQKQLNISTLLELGVCLRQNRLYGFSQNAAGQIMHHLSHTHTHTGIYRSEIAHNYSYSEQSSAQNENTASPSTYQHTGVVCRLNAHVKSGKSRRRDIIG